MDDPMQDGPGPKKPGLSVPTAAAALSGKFANESTGTVAPTPPAFQPVPSAADIVAQPADDTLARRPAPKPAPLPAPSTLMDKAPIAAESTGSNTAAHQQAVGAVTPNTLSAAPETKPDTGKGSTQEPATTSLSFFGRLARPTGKAAQNIGSTVINLGADILKGVGYDKIDEDFARWVENIPPAERNPLRFGDWAVEQYGEKPSGLAGFAEDALQFGEGFVALGAALKVPGALPGLATATARATGAAQTFFGAETALGAVARATINEAPHLAGQAFAVDASVMDPMENNLLGVIDRSPQSQQNALRRFLAYDPDSPDSVNRLKVGLQGLVVGRALERFVGAARAVKLWRAAKQLPLGSAERDALEGRIKNLVKDGREAAAAAQAPAPNPEKVLKQDVKLNGGRPSTAVQNFTNELDQTLGIGAQPDGSFRDVAHADTQGNGGVRVAFTNNGGDVVTLKTIQSLEAAPRSGKPTKVMQDITRLADQHGVTLRLNASPFGENALSREQLRDFYRKFGFEQVKEGDALMVRNPGDAPVLHRETAGAAKSATLNLHLALDVQQGADGKWQFAQEGRVLDGSPKFVTEAQAQAELAAAHDFLPPPPEFLPTLTKQIHERIMSGVNPEDVRGLTDGTAFNFHWVSSDDNAKAYINAVAEAIGNARGPKQSIAETEAIAQAKYNNLNSDGVLGLARNVAAKLEESPAQVAALRTYRQLSAEYVADLGQRITSAGGMRQSPLDAYKFVKSLNTMFELSPIMQRISSRASQTLNNGFKSSAPIPGMMLADAEQGAKAALQDVGEAAAGNGAGKAGAEAGAEAAAGAPNGAGILSKMSPEEMLAVAKQIRLTGGDPDVIDHYLRNVLPIDPPAKGSPAWETFQSIRYNSLLSGTLTHAKNIVSNFAMFLGKNVELAAGGLQAHNLDDFRQGVDQLTSMWMDARESFHVAVKAAQSGTAILDQELQKEGLQALTDAITSNPDAVPTKWLSSLWHAPQTFLMAEDEFFKQLNYRSSIRSQALRDARSQGLPATEWAAQVKDAMDGAFSPQGAGINTTALDLARENTFTRPLVGLAADGSNFIGRSNILQFFFPFRRTPINVFLAAAERTPGLWRMSTVMREELAGKHGAARATAAVAKLEMGQNLWLLATGLAASGHLSGSGPVDSEKRTQMLATGWLPFSVKNPVTNTWHSFQATEPFGTVLGIAADAVDAMDELERDGRQNDAVKLYSAFLLSSAANVYNKSFLKGMSDLNDIMSGKTNAGERVIASMGQQLVPFGGMLSQDFHADPITRDANTVSERIKTRLPYFSPGVEPVRTVLGQPLLKQSFLERTFWPFQASEEAGTEEQKLMQDILDGIGKDVQIPLPADRKYKGLIDLRDRDSFAPEGMSDKQRTLRTRNFKARQSPYDRMLELYGEGIPRGRGLADLPPIAQTLRAIVDEDHKALSDTFGAQAARFGYWKSALPTSDQDASENDTRLGILRGVLRIYQDAAWKQTLVEYPKLAAKVNQLDRAKKAARQSQRDHINEATQAYIQSATP